MRDLSDDGVAVLLITDDLPELIGLSHRILLMRDGRIVNERNTPADAKPAEEEMIKFIV